MIAVVATASSAVADPLVATVSVGGVNGTVEYSETELDQGDSFTATVTYENTNATAVNARFGLGGQTQNVSAVLELDGCTAPGGVSVNCFVDPNGDTIRADVAALPPGESVITIDLTLGSHVADGAYTYTHFLLSQKLGSNFGPPLTLTVPAPVADADIDVALDATPGPLLTSAIIYDLTATNEGPGDVTDATVDVQLPEQTNSVSGLPSGCSYNSSTDRVQCDTGSILNGDQSTQSFRANLGLLSIGSLPATASLVSSSPADPNGANNSAAAHCGVLTGLLIVCS